MKLHRMVSPFLIKKKKKRKGRGDSSGKGNFCGRGIKGAKARSGRSHFLGFEGGQTPLYRRIPKKGFTSFAQKTYRIINLHILNKFKDGEEINPEALQNKGLIEKKEKVKILGDGELEISLHVKAHKFSKKAKEKIEKKGGKAIEI